MKRLMTVLKKLTDFFNLQRSHSPQQKAWSVACCNTTIPCCPITTATKNFIGNTKDDSAHAGSFFLPEYKKSHFILQKEFLTMKPLTCNRPANFSFAIKGNTTALIVPIGNTAKHTNHAALNIQTASFFLTTIMNRMRKSLHKTGIFGLAFLIANLFLGGIAFSQPVVVTNPASPWTVPAGVASIKVEVWGGGGGGGGANGGWNTTRGGGGGGGGAYNVATFSVTPGHTFNITIGNGGTPGLGGFSPADGGQGGTTTVSGIDGNVSATGGNGGITGVGSNGSGGTGATGAHNGGNGGTSTGNGAGGGGGAGNNGNGTDGDNAATGAGGAGNPNSAPYIGGTGGAFRTNDGAGNDGPALVPGGGGGGGRATWFASHNGATGGAGQVVITYTVCPTISASATKNDVKCFNTSTGEIVVSGSGGTSPYTFSINNGTTYQASGTFSNLPAGTYKIRVKDANGCESKPVQ